MHQTAVPASSVTHALPEVLHERLLTIAVVCERTQLSRSTIWLKIQNKEFPEPVRIGARAVRWRESEVDLWIVSQVPARPTKALVRGEHGKFLKQMPADQTITPPSSEVNTAQSVPTVVLDEGEAKRRPGRPRKTKAPPPPSQEAAPAEQEVPTVAEHTLEPHGNEQPVEQTTESLGELEQTQPESGRRFQFRRTIPPVSNPEERKKCGRRKKIQAESATA